MDTLTLINSIEKIYLTYGNIIIFLSSFIETLPIGFLIPGGLMVALGGFYSFGKSSELVGVLLSSSLGMMTAFLLAYFLGNKTGLLLVKKLKQEKNADIAKTLLDKHGATILTTSLLANLTRFWVAYIAGTQKFSLFKFIFYGFIAAMSWNSLFVAMGYIAGSERNNLETGIAKLGILSYGFVLLALFFITWSIKREYKQVKGEI